MNVATLKKMAAEELGQRVLEPAPSPPPELDAIDLAKVASTDPTLLKIATILRPTDPFGMYEELGGDYRK